MQNCANGKFSVCHNQSPIMDSRHRVSECVFVSDVGIESCSVGSGISTFTSRVIPTQF